jgi:hypothetical protein
MIHLAADLGSVNHQRAASARVLEVSKTGELPEHGVSHWRLINVEKWEQPAMRTFDWELEWDQQ